MNTPREVEKADARNFRALIFIGLALLVFGISAIIQPQISDFWTVCLSTLCLVLVAGAVLRLAI